MRNPTLALSVLVSTLTGTLVPSLCAAPVNDAFATPTAIAGLPASGSGTNVQATLEQNEPTPFAPNAQGSVWFTWTPAVSAVVRVDTVGSGFDTILAVWTGNQIEALSLVGANDDSFGSLSAVSFQAQAGVSYRIAVYGYGSNEYGPVSVQVSATGAIMGSVTGDDGTGPLEGIIATAYRRDENANEWEEIASGTTRADGSYAIFGLDEETYRVEFKDETAAYQTECYEDAANLDEAADIPVGAAATVAGIDASLSSGARISGTVTGPDGITPVVSPILVKAFKLNNLTMEWNAFATSQTRTDGTYIVSGLGAGTYRLQFLDSGGGNYISEYYDNAQSLSAAGNIVVGDFAAVGGINASLATTGSIRGTVWGPEGVIGLDDIAVRAYTREGPGQPWIQAGADYTDAIGHYEIEGLLPGNYRISFQDGTGAYLTEYYNNAAGVETADDIAVGVSSVVSGINASLATGGVISGTVTASDGTSPLAGIIATAYTWNATEQFWQEIANGSTSATGNYQILGLTPGTYRVRFQDSGVGYLAECYDNVPVLAMAADIAVGLSTVSGINASLDGTSGLGGQVTGPDGSTPLAAVNVTAYRFNPATSGWVYEGETATGTNGGYGFSGLAPGTYQIQFSDYSGGHLSEYYDNSRTRESAASVAVIPSTVVTGINASLAAAGRISGTVTGPNGTLSGIVVTAYKFNPLDSMWEHAVQTITPVNGSYSLKPLEDGIYRLKFEDPAGDHVTEFHDNASTLAAAGDLVITSAAALGGINVSLVKIVPTISQIRRTGPGAMEIHFSGVAGRQYQMQESTNLTGWADVGAPFTCQPGNNILPRNSSLPKVFWRVRSVP